MHALYPKRRVMWLPLDYVWQPALDGQKHCCEDLSVALDFSCDLHSDPFDCADSVLIYHPLFREYGLILHDGGMTYLQIDFCPFCGTRLPATRRDDWFNQVERLGLENADFDDLPDDLKT